MYNHIDHATTTTDASGHTAMTTSSETTDANGQTTSYSQTTVDGKVVDDQSKGRMGA